MRELQLLRLQLFPFQLYKSSVGRVPVARVPTVLKKFLRILIPFELGSWVAG